MIHLIGDYYMTADKKPGCSYVVGIPRQTEDKRIIMRQSRYYNPCPCCGRNRRNCTARQNRSWRDHHAA